MTEQTWKTAITRIEPNRVSVRGYSIDQLMGRIEQGFDELVFALPDADADTVLPLLDDLAELAAKARGGKGTG